MRTANVRVLFSRPFETPSYLRQEADAQTQPPMKAIIHIGQLIREELRRQGRNNRWLAQRINVNIRTVNKIFEKTFIDTQQLTLISEALGVDFFRYYSDALGMTQQDAPTEENAEKTDI